MGVTSFSLLDFIVCNHAARAGPSSPASSCVQGAPGDAQVGAASPFCKTKQGSGQPAASPALKGAWLFGSQSSSHGTGFTFEALRNISVLCKV